MLKLKLKMIGSTLLFGALCGAAVGCSESQTAKTDSASTSDRNVTDRDITVTASKPIVPEQSVTTTPDVLDRNNTGVNERDRNTAAKTPFDQNENSADIKITADIRSRVVDTKMSVDAQNVKIITQDGRVTLRGPVHTTGEKATIEEIARDVAGADNVDSQLEIVQN